MAEPIKAVVKNTKGVKDFLILIAFIITKNIPRIVFIQNKKTRRNWSSGLTIFKSAY